MTLYGGDGSDTLELVKANEWVALTSFNSGNSIETIKGDGTNDAIVAAQNVNTGQAYGVLDLSSTTLVNIAQIRGTSAADDITGSKAADVINARDGNDTIRESGGADVIDGGTGTNLFVAKNALGGYTGGYTNPDGTKSFNSGTSWKLVDNTGTTITLTNIQSVQFTDQTLSSSATNSQPSAVSSASARMRFITSDTTSAPAVTPAAASSNYKSESIRAAASATNVAQDYARAVTPDHTQAPVVGAGAILSHMVSDHMIIGSYGHGSPSEGNHQLLLHTS